MKLAFAGGGTGGHLAPAAAILEELRIRGDNSPALFLTAGRSSPGMGDTFSRAGALVSPLLLSLPGDGGRFPVLSSEISGGTGRVYGN